MLQLDNLKHRCNVLITAEEHAIEYLNESATKYGVGYALAGSDHYFATAANAEVAKAVLKFINSSEPCNKEADELGAIYNLLQGQAESRACSTEYSTSPTQNLYRDNLRVAYNEMLLYVRKLKAV